MVTNPNRPVIHRFCHKFITKKTCDKLVGLCKAIIVKNKVIQDEEDCILNINGLNPPEKNEKDIAYKLIETGTSLIPGIGSAMPGIMNLFIHTPLEKRREEKRREEWEKDVTRALQSAFGKMKEMDQKIQELSYNQEFLDILIAATLASLKTSKEEKLKALRNIVINTALESPSSEESLQMMFLNLIDNFTEWHIKIFNSLGKKPFIITVRNPKPQDREIYSAITESFIKVFPDLEEVPAIPAIICNDLLSNEIFSYKNSWNRVQGDRRTSRDDHYTNSIFLTSFGKKFWKFIQQPEISSE